MARIASTLGLLFLLLVVQTSASASPFPFPDPSLQFDVRSLNRVRTMPDGSVVFSGTYTTINGQARPQIAKLNSDGTWNSAWSPAITGTVVDFQYAPSGSVYVATSAPNLIRRVSLATGVVDGSWSITPSAAPNGGLFVDETEGALYQGVAGGALKYTIATMQPVAGFNLALTGPGVGPFGLCDPNAYVRAFAKDEQGRLYVGGIFPTVGGRGRSGLARVSAADGAVDATWSPFSPAAPDWEHAAGSIGKLTQDICPGTPYYRVNSLAYRSGMLYAAGQFEYQARISVGRFGTSDSGVVDPALVSPLARGGLLNLLPIVNGVAVDAEGSAFLTSSESAAMMKFFANGSRDYSWAPTADATVRDIAVATVTGKVYAAGDFSAISSQFRAGIARLPDRNGATPDDIDGDGIPNAVEPLEGRNPQVKDNDIFAATAAGARLFAMQQYRDFLNREGDAGGIASWTAYLTGGGTRAAMVEGFFASAEFQGVISPVTRLYFAYFLRIPDYDGLQFWINYFRAGHPLPEISQAFAGSGEFTSRYGALTNDQFVDLVYQNVLGRAADAGGKAFWLGQLNGGMTRGAMMIGFSESPEYVASIGSEVNVTMTYVGMLRRAPDTGGFTFWVGYLDGGNSQQALINGFLAAQEYRQRFLP